MSYRAPLIRSEGVSINCKYLYSEPCSLNQQEEIGRGVATGGLSNELTFVSNWPPLIEKAAADGIEVISSHQPTLFIPFFCACLAYPPPWVEDIHEHASLGSQPIFRHTLEETPIVCVSTHTKTIPVTDQIKWFREIQCVVIAFDDGKLTL